MASDPEGTALLNCQTNVLKVSIHCEGCKKKVRKVLQGLEGVYAIDINSKQNKVTVTGSVNAESLIRRLHKYGKHAELWPEKKPTAANSSGEAGVDSKEKAAAPAATAPKTEQQLQNTEKKQQQTEEGKNKTTPAPPTETTAIAPVTTAVSSAISDKASASKTSDAQKCNDSDKPANSDKKDSDKPATVVDADASEEADDLKKKGKKAQGDTSSIAERAISDSDTVAERAISDSDTVGNADGATASVSPPPPKQFPVYAQPIYNVNYSAVQPSTSYAYYTPSPAAMPSSYTYSDYPSPSAHPPENYSLDPYYGSMDAPAASGGSYDMFNEENPNACNLM